MKNSIPVSQLETEVFGIRMDRINDAYLTALINKIGEAHRNDHYIWLLLETGQAELLVDFKKIILSTKSLLLLHPDQVKSIISFNHSEGWVLFFNSSLIHPRSTMAFEESFHQGTYLDISSMERFWFFGAVNLLYSTVNSHEDVTFQYPIIEALLNACISKIVAIYNTKIQLDIEKHSVRRMDITRTFRKLVLLHFKHKKSPSDYAELMHISVGYLNDTIKLVTGQNVSTYIQNTSIVEAQRLLYHTTLSIKEISENVGYDDSHYFSRVFSKITSQSPGSFRKNSQGH